MKVLHSLLLFFSALPCFAQTYRVDKLTDNGPPENRINVVILGDGFTEAQLPIFRDEAKKFADFFSAYEPFGQYKNYFNFYAVSTPSPESGISNPGTAPDAYNDHPVSKVNNFYGGTFGTEIHRLVTIQNYDLMYQVLARNFPQYDLIVMLANTTFYGGSGGNIAMHTLHSSANTIGVHEIGHTFSRLSDEYWAGISYARENINMTREANPDQVRWKDWLNHQSIGIYNHGLSGDPLNWRKPANGSCLMEHLSRQFCAVCREATVEKILSLVNPLESATPGWNSPVHITDSLEFSLDLLTPSPNSLNVIWTLNGINLEGSDAKITVHKNQLNLDNSVLKATVYDTSPMSRKNPMLRTHQASWAITGGESTKITITAEKTGICSGETTLLTVSGCSGKILWSSGETGAAIRVSPVASGDFSVQCTRSDGKILADTLTIQVNPAPVAIASNSGPVFERSTLKLFASGGTQYRWTGPLGYSSVEQNPEIPDVSISRSGIYEVSVKNDQDCYSRATTEVLINVVLANEEKGKWFKVFPNPTSEFIRIEVSPEGFTDAVLYSTDGKVLKFSSFQKLTSLNIAGLPTGIYYLKIKNGQKEFLAKISKL